MKLNPTAMTERELLWAVQTLAANLDREQLERTYWALRGDLGGDLTNEIIEEWEHELTDED